jgi:hypothetical protein
MDQSKSIVIINTPYEKSESEERIFIHVVLLCVKFFCEYSTEEFPSRELTLVVNSTIDARRRIISEVLYNIEERCKVLESGNDFIETEISVPDGEDGFETKKLRLSLGEKQWCSCDPMNVYWTNALSSLYLEKTFKSIEFSLRWKTCKIWLYVYSMVLHGIKDSREKIEKKKNVKIEDVTI